MMSLRNAQVAGSLEPQLSCWFAAAGGGEGGGEELGRSRHCMCLDCADGMVRRPGPTRSPPFSYEDPYAVRQLPNGSLRLK